MTAAPAPEATRFALVFIFITMFIDSMGFGIVLPVLPQLIERLTGEGISGAAIWGGWLGFAFALTQFLFAPFLGNLSDRFGRRPILILSLVVLGIDYLVTALAPTIAWLFVARLASGAASATYATANAYIADVSPPEQRAANFGVTGAAFSIGFIAGPALGGVIGQFGPTIPFFVAAALAGANAVFGLVVMRESLAPEYRRPFQWRRANPIGALHAMSRFPLILPLCLVVIFMRLAHDANPVIFTYFTMLRFDWSSSDIGYALMAIGALMTGVYMFGIGFIVRRIGETNAVTAGLMLASISFAGYAFATEGWMVYAAMVPFALSVVAGPALNAIMSRTVGPREQGELQGALACVGSLTTIVSPPILTGLFSWFTGPAAPIYFPGIAYFAAAIFTLTAFALFLRLSRASAVRPQGA